MQTKNMAYNEHKKEFRDHFNPKLIFMSNNNLFVRENSFSGRMKAWREGVKNSSSQWQSIVRDAPTTHNT